MSSTKLAELDARLTAVEEREDRLGEVLEELKELTARINRLADAYERENEEAA